MKVTVVGDGKLGLLATWVLRLTGAEVTLVGKHPEKLKLGGSRCRRLSPRRGGRLARSQDVVVDCTGSTSGLATALGWCTRAGRWSSRRRWPATIRLSLAPVVIDEVRVIGSRCGPFPPAIAALASRQIDVRP